MDNLVLQMSINFSLQRGVCALTNLNPIYLSSSARSSPLFAIGGYLYVLNGVYMLDIAITLYMRPWMGRAWTGRLLYRFAMLRFIRIMLAAFFLFAVARLVFSPGEEDRNTLPTDRGSGMERHSVMAMMHCKESKKACGT